MADKNDLREDEIENIDTTQEENLPDKKSKKTKKKRGKGKRGAYTNPYADQKPLDIEPKMNENGEYICPHCSKVVDKDALNCPHCKKAIRIQHLSTQYDSGDPFIALFSFFIPIIGIVLFFYWRKTKPRNAKMAGIGALVFLIIFVILIISIRPT